MVHSLSAHWMPFALRVALSLRERECLQWCAAGKTSAETGAILSISEVTVNWHLKNAARKLDANPEDVECLGEVYRAGTQDEGMSFEDVVMAALEGTGTITVKGNFDTLPESWGGKKYRGAAIGGSMAFAYAAQVVEVTVDPDTAEIKVDKVWVAHDCGKALNPLTVEGQIQGSVWMGMGQAMTEETRYHDGLMITGNMLDYRVPTFVESPPIEAHIVESNDPHGPFGAKELPARLDECRRRCARRSRSRIAGNARPFDAGARGLRARNRRRGGVGEPSWNTCPISRCIARKRRRKPSG